MIKFNIIYMAAGHSKRFGSNKLLFEYNGKSIYKYGFDAMLEVKAGLIKRFQKDIAVKIIAVSSYKEILSYAESFGEVAIENEPDNEGISSSIRLGTAYEVADYYMYMPSDMPFVNPKSITKLCVLAVENFKEPRYSLFALSDNQNIAYSPCVFADIYRKELLALRGDKGGKAVFCKYPQNTAMIAVKKEELKDIDFLADL